MSQISRRSLLTAGSGLSLAAATTMVRPVKAQTIDPMMSQAQTVPGDAFSVMSSIPELTTWVQLVSAGGLEAQARAPVPFTIFPVTNHVWDQHPDYVKKLLGYLYTTGGRSGGQDVFPDNSLIVRLVRSHVVRGKHYANEMMGKKVTVTTVAGTPLTVDATVSPVVISWNSAYTGAGIQARLTLPPITCYNAVIYPIDNAEVA